MASTSSAMSVVKDYILKEFLPGDTYQKLDVQTELNVNGSDLILLPFHVVSYRYHDRVFRFLVNGQTGQVVGQKPWSVRRLVAVVVVSLLVVVMIALLIAWLVNL